MAGVGLKGLLCTGAGNDDVHELEEGEWIPDENNSSNTFLNECLSIYIYLTCSHIFVLHRPQVNFHIFMK